MAGAKADLATATDGLGTAHSEPAESNSDLTKMTAERGGCAKAVTTAVDEVDECENFFANFANFANFVSATAGSAAAEAPIMIRVDESGGR